MYELQYKLQYKSLANWTTSTYNNEIASNASLREWKRLLKRARRERAHGPLIKYRLIKIIVISDK